jgi:hypothetical protein
MPDSEAVLLEHISKSHLVTIVQLGMWNLKSLSNKPQEKHEVELLAMWTRASP